MGEQGFCQGCADFFPSKTTCETSFHLKEERLKVLFKDMGNTGGASGTSTRVRMQDIRYPCVRSVGESNGLVSHRAKAHT